MRGDLSSSQRNAFSETASFVARSRAVQSNQNLRLGLQDVIGQPTALINPDAASRLLQAADASSNPTNEPMNAASLREKIKACSSRKKTPKQKSAPMAASIPVVSGKGLQDERMVRNRLNSRAKHQQEQQCINDEMFARRLQESFQEPWSAELWKSPSKNPPDVVDLLSPTLKSSGSYDSYFGEGKTEWTGKTESPTKSLVKKRTRRLTTNLSRKMLKEKDEDKQQAMDLVTDCINDQSHELHNVFHAVVQASVDPDSVMSTQEVEDVLVQKAQKRQKKNGS